MKSTEGSMAKKNSSEHKTKEEESSSSEKHYTSKYDKKLNSEDLNKKGILNGENREDNTFDHILDKKDEEEDKIITTNGKNVNYTEKEKTEEFESYKKDKTSSKNNVECFNDETIDNFSKNVEKDSSLYARNATVCSSDSKEKCSINDGKEIDLTKKEKDDNSSNKENNFVTDMSCNKPIVFEQGNNFVHNLNVEASSSDEKYYSLNNDKASNNYNSNKKNDASSSEKDLRSVDIATKDKKVRIAVYSKDENKVKHNENDITNYSSKKRIEAHKHNAKGNVDDLTHDAYSSDDNESMKALSSTVSDINLFLDDIIDKLEQSSEESSKEQKPFSSAMRLDPVKSYVGFHRKSFNFEMKPCNSCEFLDPDEEEKNRCCGLCKKEKKRYLEFWIIAVPKDDDTWATLNDETIRKNLSQNYKFHIPELKVGVLNDLISLTEQLLTLDNYVKDVVEKICDNAHRVRASIKNVLDETFQIYDLDAAVYLTRFTWNNSKYSTKQPVRNISDNIFSVVAYNEKILKEKANFYEECKTKLRKYERREQEPLQNRFLGDIVKKENFVLNSQFLTTLLIVVPNDKVNLWWKSYENICEMVVPNSSQKIFDDGSHSLFNVTIYKKKVKEFKSNARKMKFVVREFQFSEKKMETERAYIKHLSKMKTKHRGSLSKFINISFVECFEAWIHVKALRIFVESVVRYGFPVNFQAMLIQPKKSKNKLKKVLQHLYSKVDVSLASGSLSDIPGNLAIFNVQEYYPYVCVKIDLNFLYKQKN